MVSMIQMMLIRKIKYYLNEQENLFKRARKNYLARKPIPAVRSNYYITGNGGAGKSVAAKAMARSLFPNLPDEKIFFTIGDGKVAFDRYDGQPVIIWDDWRAEDLLSMFDRGTVWKYLQSIQKRFHCQLSMEKLV